MKSGKLSLQTEILINAYDLKKYYFFKKIIINSKHHLDLNQTHIQEWRDQEERKLEDKFEESELESKALNGKCTLEEAIVHNAPQRRHHKVQG